MQVQLELQHAPLLGMDLPEGMLPNVCQLRVKRNVHLNFG